MFHRHLGSSIINGKGAAIAAGAAVDKDAQEFFIVGGLPACLIKK
jgi:acetyltransferase-like isoleucine patch superfamily enzyme